MFIPKKQIIAKTDTVVIITVIITYLTDTIFM